MFKLQISSPIWLLCNFLSIGCCFTTFQRGQAAAVTDPNEVILLKSLAQKWNGINTWTTWNLTGDPCKGLAIDSSAIPNMNHAFKCDCTFKDGTTCHVTQMRVSGRDITGEIPEELAKLTYLWNLDLGKNYLTGPIPAFFGNLTRLQYLSVGLNNLSGPVPKELGNLHSSISLGIDSNSFTGTLPPELGNLASLEQLYICSAGLSGEIPSTFGKLRSLKILWAFDNQFTGGITDFIGSWKNLTDLDLSFNNFTGGIPDSLQSLSNLTFLLLGSNNLSGKLPSQKSASLAYIDLSYNHFSGALPTWLSDKNLKVNLVGNYFATDETENRFSGRGLGCLQRTFPCNKGAPRYFRFAINCGGGQNIYVKGDDFEPENEPLNSTSFYVRNTQKWGVSYTGLFVDSGNPTSIATNQSQITKTLDSELYQTARLCPSSLRYYGLGLQNGPYTVKLHFAEIQFENTNSWKSVGRRIFDVYAQGKKVLTVFDIRKEAGGSNIAVVRSFNNITVTTNFLEIHFFWAGKGSCCIPFQGSYGPLVSAISVTPEFNPTKSKKIKTGIVIGIITGIAVPFICIILGFLLWRRRVQNLAKTDTEEDKAINVIRSKLRIFSYEDVKAATGDFDRENKLGEGGYGAVYKGTLSDGEMVAVKKLSSESRQGKREFINEVAVISTVQHKEPCKVAWMLSRSR